MRQSACNGYEFSKNSLAGFIFFKKLQPLLGTIAKNVCSKNVLYHEHKSSQQKRQQYQAAAFKCQRYLQLLYDVMI